MDTYTYDCVDVITIHRFTHAGHAEVRNHIVLYIYSDDQNYFASCLNKFVVAIFVHSLYSSMLYGKWRGENNIRMLRKKLINYVACMHNQYSI